MQNISDIDSDTDSDSSNGDTIIYSDSSVYKGSNESNDEEDISHISLPSASKWSTSLWSYTIEILPELPF